MDLIDFTGIWSMTNEPAASVTWEPRYIITPRGEGKYGKGGLHRE